MLIFCTHISWYIFIFSFWYFCPVMCIAHAGVWSRDVVDWWKPQVSISIPLFLMKARAFSRNVEQQIWGWLSRKFKWQLRVRSEIVCFLIEKGISCKVRIILKAGFFPQNNSYLYIMFSIQKWKKKTFIGTRSLTFHLHNVSILDCSAFINWWSN